MNNALQIQVYGKVVSIEELNRLLRIAKVFKEVPGGHPVLETTLELDQIRLTVRELLEVNRVATELMGTLCTSSPVEYTETLLSL